MSPLATRAAQGLQVHQNNSEGRYGPLTAEGVPFPGCPLAVHPEPGAAPAAAVPRPTGPTGRPPLTGPVHAACPRLCVGKHVAKRIALRACRDRMCLASACRWGRTSEALKTHTHVAPALALMERSTGCSDASRSGPASGLHSFSSSREHRFAAASSSSSCCCIAAVMARGGYSAASRGIARHYTWFLLPCQRHCLAANGASSAATSAGARPATLVPPPA